MHIFEVEARLVLTISRDLSISSHTYLPAIAIGCGCTFWKEEKNLYNPKSILHTNVNISCHYGLHQRAKKITAISPDPLATPIL